MTEWLLQESLTRRWLDSGICLGDEKLLLAAWEVMVPWWGINDAGARWNEPSIDFLAIDGSGRLVAIELKVAVPGRKPAWAVVCQVTHRAVRIARTATPERLERAHAACIRGEHGRTEFSTGEVASISSRFSEFSVLSYTSRQRFSLVFAVSLPQHRSGRASRRYDSSSNRTRR